jgi:hypothetical protein
LFAIFCIRRPLCLYYTLGYLAIDYMHIFFMIMIFDFESVQTVVLFVFYFIIDVVSSVSMIFFSLGRMTPKVFSATWFIWCWWFELDRGLAMIIQSASNIYIRNSHDIFIWCFTLNRICLDIASSILQYLGILYM